MAESLLRAVDVRSPGGVPLAGLSLSAAAGALTVVIGVDGRAAGCAVLADLLVGRGHPERGSIHWLGRPITRRTVAERVRAGLVGTASPPLDLPGERLVDALVVAMIAPGGGWPADLLRRRAPPALAMAAGEVLDFVGLSALAGSRPRALDVTERALLELARVLALRPKLIVVDRLAASLPASAKPHLLKLVHSIAVGGIAVVWLEEDDHPADSAADQLVLLGDGRALAAGPAAVVRASAPFVAAFPERR
ncbi:MAG: ATP-binding cassette domain-containing protein [Pseudomonadota bacterium]